MGAKKGLTCHPEHGLPSIHSFSLSCCLQLDGGRIRDPLDLGFCFPGGCSWFCLEKDRTRFHHFFSQTDWSKQITVSFPSCQYMGCHPFQEGLKLSKQIFIPRTIIADKAKDSEQREKVTVFP